MKKILLSSLCLLFASVPAFAQKGGVAVLDIDEVARQLGVEEKVRVDLINMQNNLNAELQRTQETFQNQMTSVEKAAGENPSEEKQRQILATNQQLNEEFNKFKLTAQNQLAQERVRMINEFRVRLEPIALKAAQELGLEVVLMKVTPPVFTYANSVDITQTTTKLALEAGLQVKADEIKPAPTAAPAPAPAAAPAAPADNKDIKGGSDDKGKAKGKGKGE
ncbi:MAG TPA: OmpH family outer membrane protein [Bacteroidia bacterium]|nr:OmpH family outer membrane protein [Bacteroidia bacterium]